MTRRIRLLLVVGARPQIIKAAALYRAWADGRQDQLDLVLLHTGQHYDPGMSARFFDELALPRPDIELGVGSASHGVQTAHMVEGIEASLVTQRPDAVVLFGDTNSTIAGALAAVKLHIPIAHVEAGLRSYNKTMPEEVNRVLCDHCSTWLFCPTPGSVLALGREGFAGDGTRPTADRPAVVHSGDVMYDNSLHFARAASDRSNALQRLQVTSGQFILATLHRDLNTDVPDRLGAILTALLEATETYGLPIVMPLHPRTRKCLAQGLSRSVLERIESAPGFRLLEPVGFLDMIELERHSAMIVTDSGGVQKEAYFFGRPCVVLRPETEWTELVEWGMAQLVDADPVKIRQAVAWGLQGPLPQVGGLFGDGMAAGRILDRLVADLG